MSKHTPGPWFVTGNMTRYVEARIGGGLIQEIAAVGPTSADDGYGQQQIANARLIAAAPDLLEALELVQDCLVKCLTGGEVSAKLAGKAIAQAAEVIEKVRGES